jgi:transcriptional regulator with XRE-family HTH domain
MARLSPERLGQEVVRKRGSMGIRAAAGEIGISPATLSRVERGHLPDSRRLGMICMWLGIEPGEIIGHGRSQGMSGMPAVQIGFKKGQAFRSQTAKSLAKLIVAAHRQFVEVIESEGR